LLVQSQLELQPARQVVCRSSEPARHAG
jgi:hypothetical protein